MKLSFAEIDRLLEWAYAWDMEVGLRDTDRLLIIRLNEAKAEVPNSTKKKQKKKKVPRGNGFSM